MIAHYGGHKKLQEKTNKALSYLKKYKNQHTLQYRKSTIVSEIRSCTRIFVIKYVHTRKGDHTVILTIIELLELIGC